MDAPSQAQVDAALKKRKKEGDDDGNENLNETNYDEFSGGPRSCGLRSISSHILYGCALRQ